MRARSVVDVERDHNAVDLGRDITEIDLDLFAVVAECLLELGHRQIRRGQLIEEHEVLIGRRPALGVTENRCGNEVVGQCLLGTGVPADAEHHPGQAWGSPG